MTKVSLKERNATKVGVQTFEEIRKQALKQREKANEERKANQKARTRSNVKRLGFCVLLYIWKAGEKGIKVSEILKLNISNLSNVYGGKSNFAFPTVNRDWNSESALEQPYMTYLIKKFSVNFYITAETTESEIKGKANEILAGHDNLLKCEFGLEELKAFLLNNNFESELFE